MNMTCVHHTTEQ